MKEELIEYHPNDSIKHIILYHPNGNKSQEQFYDQLERDHRDEGLPDYQKWYENGITNIKTYFLDGGFHNIYNPCKIKFNENGKIWYKRYSTIDMEYVTNNLIWSNFIKNI